MSSGRRPMRSDSIASGRISTSATRQARVMDRNASVAENCSVVMKYDGMKANTT